MPSSEMSAGQLALLDYHAYTAEEGPCFSHMLICSTAPLEAELPFRSDMSTRELEGSADRFLLLRRHLRLFFAKPGAGEGSRRLRLVVRIHGYNVPLKSVREEYADTARKFQDDARHLAQDPPNDFVLFIHFAWPSERIGAGGPLRWIRAMPIGLILLFVLGGVLGFAASGLAAVLGHLSLGIGITLMLLRMVTYFRDRDRASTFGVTDAVEMIRALHHLVQEIGSDTDYLTRLSRGEASRISLSFLAHSMGCFLTTSMIRVLSNVFDADADRHLWEVNPEVGPFAAASCPAPVRAETREQLRRELATIGDLFILDRLILVAADIPVWAITTGRSNDLASCLRRFRDTFLFVNDADMVLRLASTVANYFVFPSGTRIGGTRLGNLTIAGRGRPNGYGWRSSDLRDVRLNGGLRTMSLYDERIFRCPQWLGFPLNVVDCTDYTDRGRHLSVFTATDPLLRPLNYTATFLMMLLAPLGIGQIDSHGGYFRGRFCLDLLHELALRGIPQDPKRWTQIQDGLEQHRITWISIPSDGSQDP